MAAETTVHGNNVMTLQDRIYSRTPAGDVALTSVDVATPADYRRILGVIEGDTHSDVIRGQLRQFPDALLADWLSELEELGFVHWTAADPTHGLDFSSLVQSKPQGARTLVPQDKLRAEKQASVASAKLYRKGVFLSPDRLKQRPALAKKPSEIVVQIVEDDPDQAALANLRVHTAGYQVRIASNCRQFAHDVRVHPHPDVVMLDVMLPDGNGFDVLASMRRHTKLALLPVVMLTALANPDEIIRSLTLGADGYITKPYSKKILSATIRAVLKHE